MYQFKDIYTLDFTNVTHFLEIHFIIRRELDFPDYYGCNWDAFWDCLTDMYGRPVHIEILGLDVIEQNFGDAAEKMLTILKRFKHFEASFTNDILIEIVRGDSREILA